MKIIVTVAIIVLYTLGWGPKIHCQKANEVVISGPTNIILVMGDDHGWEETGYNGHPFIKTPVLDQMAKNGLRFDQFYSAHPSCAPTRASIITGRHPNRYATFTPGWSIRPEEISIAQLLKKAGYTTGHFGKWHLGPVAEGSPTSPGAMGFDTWVSHDNFFEFDPLLSRNGAPPVVHTGEGSEVIVDETISFISQAKQQEHPFFAVVWFGSPHEPYQGLPKDLALYNHFPDSIKNKFVELTSIETGLPVRRRLDSVLRERYAEITAMDRAIGKLRNYLNKEGIGKNTLIWYCGDNGIDPNGFYHSIFRGHKEDLYQGGIRVPGIIEWPEKIKKGKNTSFNSVTTDMFTTICDLLNIPLPNRPIDGVSVMPVIDNPRLKRVSPIYFWKFDIKHLTDKEPYIDPKLQKGTTPMAKKLGNSFTRNFVNYHHRQILEDDYLGTRAVLGNQYKLVVNFRRDIETTELFDIVKDPGEKKNISASNSDILDKMKEELRQWQNSVLRSLTGADYRHSSTLKNKTDSKR